MKTTPLSLGNIILLREKGEKESIPSQVDKKSGFPEEETGVWNSGGGGKDKRLFFFSTFLNLSHINLFSLSPKLMITQQTTQFKLCTKGYITTLYPD